MSTWAGTVSADPAQAIRILQVAGTATGGILQHVSMLLRGLDRDRYLLGVACPAGHELVAVGEELHLPVHVVRIGRSLWAQAAAAMSLAGLARREGYHLLHTHSFTAGTAGCLATLIYPRVTVVSTVHNYLAPAGRRRRQVERAALRLMARRASRVITVSRTLASLLPPGAQAQVIYNGLPPVVPASREEARAALGVTGPGPVVGMVARLAAEKGVLQFVRVAARIAQQMPEVQFVLVGEGPLLEAVKEMVAGLHLTGRFRLTGRLEQAGRLFAGMEVALVPSLWEGASITAIEAMAARCPVVASGVGALPEMLDEGRAGVVADSGDEEGMAQAVMDLLENEPRRQELIAAGWEHSRSFTAAAMLEQTQAVYSSLFDRKR